MKKELQIFKALSDETRLRIILLLLNGELCVCDLENILNTTQSKISRHLSYLKNSGLVKDRRNNVWVYYSINDVENNNFISSLLSIIESNFKEQPFYNEDNVNMKEWFKKKKVSC